MELVVLFNKFIIKLLEEQNVYLLILVKIEIIFKMKILYYIKEKKLKKIKLLIIMNYKVKYMKKLFLQLLNKIIII